MNQYVPLFENYINEATWYGYSKMYIAWVDPSGKVYELKDEEHEDWSMRMYKKSRNEMFADGWADIRILWKDESMKSGAYKGPDSTATVNADTEEIAKRAIEAVKQLSHVSVMGVNWVIVDVNSPKFIHKFFDMRKREDRIEYEMWLAEGLSFNTYVSEGRYAAEARTADELAAWIDPNGEMHTVRTLSMPGNLMYSHLGWWQKMHPDMYPDLSGRVLNDQILRDGWMRVSFSTSSAMRTALDVGIQVWTEADAKKCLNLMYEDFLRGKPVHVFADIRGLTKHIAYDLKDGGDRVRLEEFIGVGKFIRQTVK